MLLGILGASLLGDLLTKKLSGRGVIRAGEGTISAGYESKKFIKYISFFDYFDKSLIVLSIAIGGLFIASFTTVIGIPIGITSASLILEFSLCTGLVKNY